MHSFFCLNTDTTCCVTGHRPNVFGGYDESLPLIQRIKQNMYHMIHNLHIYYNIDTFITGLALGVDTWFAETVLLYKSVAKTPIHLVGAKPFHNQECRWPQNTINRYNNICRQADYIHIVSEGEYHPFKMQKRNMWMVDHSKIVIPVKLPHINTGGTVNCIKYAEQCHKEIIYLMF